MKILFKVALLAIIFSFSSCKSFNKKNINLFTVDYDRQLGAQVAQEIDQNTKEYPTLDSTRYSGAYQYLYHMRDKILNSGKVKHKNDFVWRLRIINDPNTVNAFCTPGGYIYVYTGLIKFLEAEDELAGVLAHEIAHADLRHSTRQLTNRYGLQYLLKAVAGDAQMISEIAGSLIGLKFSRNHETEADEYSVHYLCPTDYDAAGGAKFFEKIQAQGGASMPAFLSTHPNPDNRIENFYNTKQAHNCSGEQTHKNAYNTFKSMLPL